MRKLENTPGLFCDITEDDRWGLQQRKVGQLRSRGWGIVIQWQKVGKDVEARREVGFGQGVIGGASVVGGVLWMGGISERWMLSGGAREMKG